MSLSLSLQGPDGSADLTGATYKVRNAAMPAPRLVNEKGEAFGLWMPARKRRMAEYSLELDVVGDTEQDAEDAVADLERLLGTRPLWLLWATSDGITLRCAVAGAHMVEPAYTHRRRLGRIRMTLVLTCHPVWESTTTYELGEHTLSAPGMVAIPTTVPTNWPLGDAPAGLWLKLTSNTAQARIGVGLHVGGTTDYDPVDTHTPSSTALSSSSWTALTSASSYDAEANSGPTIIMPDVKTSGVAESVWYRAHIETQGAVVTETSEKYVGPAVNSTSADYEQVPLLPVTHLPGCAMPSISGGGWGSESLLDSETAGVLPGEYFTKDLVYVTSATISGLARLTKAAVWLKNSGSGFSSSSPIYYIEVYKVSGGQPSGSPIASAAAYGIAAGFEGEVELDFSAPVEVDSGEYAVGIRCAIENAYIQMGEVSHAGWASADGGASWSTSPASGVYFKLYGEDALSFASTMDIEAKAASGTPNAECRSVTRLPARWWAVVMEGPFDADEGFILDGLDTTRPTVAFSTTSATDSIGPPREIMALSGEPALWPAANQQLVVAANGTVTISGFYRPRYVHAAGGWGTTVS